jgi:hypothetical protein
MAEKLEQHAAVKFCFLLGKTARETVLMLETAYKEARKLHWGKHTSLRVVFPLQEWRIVTCRPTSLRATLDLPNG